ncbi:hypothetical protein ABEG18_23210 [Alsobacter sp. KACC 23698]|uniref:Dipeptidyl aminopeptidase n=1 Tax=Alsobacter sp. KACC 23698 TaxID=3149229 RepID=A0AAU7JE42_9HYPH
MARYLVARRFALVAALFALAALAVRPARAEDPTPQLVQIGSMQAQLFLPPGGGQRPVVIFSHGRATKAEGRAALRNPIPLGHAGYWLGKGFAVVAPIRPGYGATGGPDRESSGARWDEQGRCLGAPHAMRAANTAADAVEEALAWVRAQGWARRDRILLVGQSVGGLASVVLGGRNPPGVIGVVNFSGGTGGDPVRHPGQSCGVEDVAQAFAAAGRSSHGPSLWLYAVNDQYWGAEAPALWSKRFAEAGGRVRFVMTGPVPDPDGHNLMRRGGRLWSEHVNPFVRTLGL